MIILYSNFYFVALIFMLNTVNARKWKKIGDAMSSARLINVEHGKKSQSIIDYDRLGTAFMLPFMAKKVTAQSKLTSNSLFLKCVTAVFSGNKKRPVDMQTNNNVELLQKLWDIVGVGILMFSSK